MRLLTGSHAPQGGDVGDYFYDERTAELYGPKARDGWPTDSVNIKGPQYVPSTHRTFFNYEPFLIFVGLILLLTQLDINANTLAFLPLAIAIANLFWN